MSHFFSWLKKELLHALPAIIYFCLSFNLIFFVTGLTLHPDAVRFFNYASVTLFALVVAKILIILDYFSFVNAFPTKPLIYNITWKFILYGIVVFIVEIGEKYLEIVYHVDLAFANFRLAEALQSPKLWSTYLWLLMVFLIYIIFSEFARVLGAKKIWQIVFG